MRDLDGKVTTDTLLAAEWNDIPTELQSMILDFGQSLSSGDLDQVGKAIAAMVGCSDFYSETGSDPIAYVATKIGAKQALDASVGLTAVHDGLRVRFRPGTNNTGASTIAVNGIVAKDIKREDGTPTLSGDLLTTKDVTLRYNAATDEFFLVGSSLNSAGLEEVFVGHLVVVVADTLTFDQSAAYAYNIDTMIAVTSAGSIDVTVQIDGVTVTGMSAVTVDSTEDTLTASALRSVAIGQKVTVIFASPSGGPADFAFTMKITRT